MSLFHPPWITWHSIPIIFFEKKDKIVDEAGSVQHCMLMLSRMAGSHVSKPHGVSVLIPKISTKSNTSSFGGSRTPQHTSASAPKLGPNRLARTLASELKQSITAAGFHRRCLAPCCCVLFLLSFRVSRNKSSLCLFLLPSPSSPKPKRVWQAHTMLVDCVRGIIRQEVAAGPCPGLQRGPPPPAPAPAGACGHVNRLEWQIMPAMGCHGNAWR